MNQLMKGIYTKHILSSDTVITANRTIKDTAGRIYKRQEDFLFVNIAEADDDYMLTVMQIPSNSLVQIRASDIIALDGMMPERFVDVYDINPDGSDKKIGKKRGRKPKNRTII